MAGISGSLATHAEPRISEYTFADVLARAGSPARSEIRRYWSRFLDAGVDPCFGLAQFYAESAYGKLGWNLWADLHSWGNVLYENRTISECEKYEASNGFNYAKYPDWTAGVRDYVGLLGQYEEWSPDLRIGDITTIYGATAKWIAKVPGSEQHLAYLNIVLWRMGQYMTTTRTKGEMSIQAGQYATKRYRLRKGTPLYDEPGGLAYGTFRGTDTNVRWVGFHNNTSWGAIVIHTQHGSSVPGVAEDMVVWIANVHEEDLW